MRDMKDSGVAWIGEIPEKWDISTINSLYTLRNQKVSDRDYPPLSVTMKGIVPQLETAAKTDAHDDRKLVKKGDFAINSRSDRRGSCGISDYDGSVSLINTVLTPRGEMYPVYYNWLFHSSSFADEFYRWGHGIVDDLWTTRWQEMRNITIPVPEYAVQQKIAAHLDHKCTQIDALISNAQQQIEKLKAYKQSVITETVTKGLDSDVQMKDSGVEWIGEIPGNAELTKVSHLFNVILGKMVSPTKSKADETLESYFCAANVHFDDLQYDELKTMWFDSNEKETYLVQKGDLLVVEGGAGAGGSHIVEKDIENCYVQNSVMIVRRKKHVPEKWLYYIIYMLVKNNYIDYVCNKATIPHFTKDKLNNTPVVFYKEEQMKKMIAYLDRKCTQIDKLIALKQQKIEKLQQYKKSLIYEYVTGKKEV